MNPANRIIRNLTFKLEGFTSLIPIPTFVYFIALLGTQQDLGNMKTVFGAGLFCGTYTVIWGILIRYYRLRKLFAQTEQLKNGELDLEQSRDLKLSLIKYPFVEGRTILYRWIVGHITGYMIYVIVIHDWGLYSLFVETLGLLFVLPISYVMYVFSTEHEIRTILREPHFQKIDVDVEKHLYVGYFRRILLALFAVGIIPITIFGFFLFSSFTSQFHLEHPEFHILALSFQAIASMFIVSYVVARSVKTSLSDINNILTEVGKGNFNMNSSFTTADDFGKQGKLIGTVIQNLKALYEEINHLNQNLEKKVDERTKELANSLDLVTNLKLQQDGDYYLTSLLLKPLGTNTSKKGNVNIEFKLKQKKTFEFRNKKSEIGGDLCRSDSIYLRGKEYAVFFNADAMGKSIQGAGGALVLGAVFGSILERTKLDENIQNYYPEKWLKNAFIELHKIFESFDGSMLISIVLGLVEIHTGFVYFINAEHPFTVLYRDGKATFIDIENTYRKLGVSLANEFIKVSGFQIYENDILLNGSDGREDLIEQGQGLTSDPYRFLSIVEKTGSDLNELTKVLETEYELSDDLSLLKIQLAPSFISPEEKWKQQPISPIEKEVPIGELKALLLKHYNEFRIGNEKNPYHWKELLNPLIRNRLLRESFDVALAYIELIPGDLEVIFLASYLARILGQYVMSIELGERVRVRSPEHLKNLYNLVLSYKEAGNEKRARKILSELKTSLSEANVNLKKKILHLDEIV